MQRLITLLLLPFFLVPGHAQYELETGKELTISGIGLGLNVGTIFLNKSVAPLSEEEIFELNPLDIPKIDRWIIQNYNIQAQKSSDIALISSFVAPLTLIAADNARNNLGEVGLMSLETLLLNTGVTNLTKILVKRPRPYLYNPELPMEIKRKVSARYSFYSGHTSNTAAMYFLTAKLFNDYQPDSDLKPVIWGVAALIPAYTGMQRVRGGKHFLTDVIVGYVLGAAIGILVPELHAQF